MDEPTKELQALWTIDGIYYPCHRNLINAIKKNEAGLLANTPDAIKVRKWLREKRREDDDEAAGWIGHLWLVSEILENSARESPTGNWPYLPTRTRQRKAIRIKNLITELIESLEDKDLPSEPIKAYELFDSWAFFYSMNNSLRIHDFAEKEQKKPLYQDSITDLLRTLKARYDGLENQTFGRESGSKPSRGNMKVRQLANGLADYLMRRYKPKSMPHETIAALLSIHFPTEAITAVMVREWLR